ncbi:MAG: MotA/TolQ/ExbB proton channel family protein [Candidatus Hydrogenedentota bacterium]
MKHAIWMLLLCLVMAMGTAIAQEGGVEAFVEAPDSPELTQAEDAAGPREDAAGADAAMAETLTLWDMMEHGGVILWVIAGLGFIALVMALFLLLTVSAAREAPRRLYKRAMAQLTDGDLHGAHQMCARRDELLARVLAAGLRMADRERFVIQEAMESEGERGATALWQRIAYLHNIAQLTPLLGLLGTVWGMMQAFGSIAFDEAQVKGINMAYSVSTAMVTTAAGLAVAIPILAVYYILRGRVTKITALIEAQASEFVELISGGQSS